SLTAVGPAVPVAGSQPSVDYDVALAGDGSSLVAYAVGDSADVENLQSVTYYATRYDASGKQVGDPVTLGVSDTNLGVSAAMDADGDAVVAYGISDADGVHI